MARHWMCANAWADIQEYRDKTESYTIHRRISMKKVGRVRRIADSSLLI